MQSNIEQQVMASVGVIYTARQLLSATALKLYVLAAGLYTLVQLTWVHKVFANWAQVGWGGSWQFTTYAMFHTHLAVQLTLALVAVAGVWFLVDITRPLLRPHQSLLHRL
jgi:hypothetical protein